MSDLISKQEAIDTIQHAFDKETILNSFVRKVAIDALQVMPSIQPESQWIPISEKLPKLDEAVLATTEWNDITIAWRTGIDKWYIYEGNINSTTDDLIAWMYLPKPYKVERKTNARQV